MASKHPAETALAAALADANAADIGRLVASWPAEARLSRAVSQELLRLACTEPLPLDVVRFAISMGASPNVATEDAGFPLSMAAWNGNAPLAELLLDLGAKIDFDQGQGLSGGSYDGAGTALCIAVECGHLDVVKLLLARGAKPDGGKSSKEIGTPLLFALEHEPVQLEVIDALLDAGANPNGSSPDARPLDVACAMGAVDVVRRLLDRGADPRKKDRDGRTALHEACAAGHVAVVELLLERGASVTAKDQLGQTALDVAGSGDHPALLAALEARGLRVVTSLDALARRGDVGALVARFDAGATPDAALLFVATEAGQADVLRLLVARGAPVDVHDRFGQTALHFSARTGRAILVGVLLELGAAVNARTHDGETPLHLALASETSSSYAAPPIVLLDGAPRITSRETPAVAVTRQLLAARADVDAPNGRRESPLHVAARAPAEPAVVDLLLDAGARPNLLDQEGKTPLDQAKPASLRALLRARGARLASELDGNRGGGRILLS